MADLDALAPLFDEYRQFQGQRGDVAAARGFLRLRLDHGEAVVLLAQDMTGAPLGLALLYPTFSSVALKRVFVLNDLYVRPEARRCGVARLLLRAVVAHAQLAGAARVTLNVAHDNTAAQRVYEALGWQADRQFRMYHAPLSTTHKAPATPPR